MSFRKALTLIFFSLLIVTLMIGPANGDVSVEGKLYRERDVKAGGTYQGSVTVSNKGDSTFVVKIYQTDYRTYSDGRVVYGDPGKQPRSNADWIELDQNQLQIGPGDKRSFHYEVKVPDEKLVGTYWSTIMVEPLKQSLEEKQADGTTLTQTVRYCVKIVTNIGDTGKRDLEITDLNLSKQDGEPVLQIGAKNSGERVLFPTVWAEVYSTETGEKVGRFTAGRKHVFPGSTVGYRIGLSELPTAKYETMLVFDNGDENVWGTQFKLNL